jgi:hypothetical protein
MSVAYKILHIVLQDPVIQWIQHVQPVFMHLSRHIEPFVMDVVTLLLWVPPSFVFILTYLFSFCNLVC